MSVPPTYIFASTRTRREVAARRGPGRGLVFVVLVLVTFWAGLGVGAAVLFAGLSL